MKTLIAYFSAEANTTKRIAVKLAEETGFDIFEIRPQKPYTKADLNYMNPLSRCNREKIAGKEVPFEGTIPDFESYDRVLIGFPVWYGGAPNIVNTFCSSFAWDQKKVYAFATSGGSPIGRTAEKLKPFVSGASSVEAKLVHSWSDVKEWIG
jgi:flavodoxin